MRMPFSIDAGSANSTAIDRGLVRGIRGHLDGMSDAQIILVRDDTRAHENEGSNFRLLFASSAQA
jgi:hypothetical protein